MDYESAALTKHELEARLVDCIDSGNLLRLLKSQFVVA